MSQVSVRRGGFPWLALVLAFFALGVAGYAVASYLMGNPADQAFVENKVALQAFRPTMVWTASLVTHAAGGSLALLAGAAQWLGVRWGRGRPKFRRFHVVTGLLYSLGIAVGAAAGLVLAIQPMGGWISAWGFGALDVLWIATTARGVQLGWLLRRLPTGAATAELRSRHRAWMTRSYALTAAAITLRIWLPLAIIAGLDFLSAYRVIAWLCWVPNLLFAQFLVSRARRLARLDIAET